MNKILMSVLLLVTCAIPLLAQQAQGQTTAAAEAGTETSVAAKNLNIQSGTQLSGELQKTIDVRKAKVGDPVVLKTTKAIKSEGRKVVHKGAKLHGQVTEVTQKTKANAASSISILFDRLEDGSLSIPITATISSITRAHSSTTANDSSFRSDSEAQSASGTSMQSAPASGRGGLVGGVSNTVGGAVNSSTSTVGNVVGGATSTTGSVVGTTGNVVGSSTAGLSGSLSKIQISESSSTSASGTSVLSLTGENLRVEKGATFNLVVTQSSNAQISRQP